MGKIIKPYHVFIARRNQFSELIAKRSMKKISKKGAIRTFSPKMQLGYSISDARSVY